MTNQNRPGYKHTPLGWIPEEWEIKKMREVAKVQGGYAFDSRKFANSGKYQVVKMSNLYNGAFDLERSASFLSTLTAQEECFRLKHNDILLTLTGTIGKRDYGYSYRINGEEDLVLNQRVARLIAVKEKADPIYLSYEVKTNRILDQFFFSARGGTGNQANVGTGDVELIKVVTPPLAEQKKIAAVLSTWDEAITKTQQHIALLQQRNKGLKQQLLTGKKRLKGYNQPWREIHLAEAFNERNETGFINLDLLSVGSLGVYPQSQSEKRDTSNSDKAKYKRICPGDIGYNTMRMWQGRSALSSLEGIVSPAYTIVTPKDGQHSEFYAYLFKLPSVVNKFFRNSQGLVEDTLNCKFKDFAIVKVEVPEYEEQVAIANVLTTAQAEIKSYEQKLNALQQQKKGLMQKLLTGEVRVKI